MKCANECQNEATGYIRITLYGPETGDTFPAVKTVEIDVCQPCGQDFINDALEIGEEVPNP